VAFLFKYVSSCVFAVLLLCTAYASASAEVRAPLLHEVQIRMDLVKELQEYELRFGFVPTNNFRTYQEDLESYALCFFAGPLSFDVTYAGEGSDCAFDERTHDVYKYTIEALAGIKTPLTQDLVNTSPARFIMVVFHEDFHEQMSDVPTWAINESASTLMGLLLAREFVFQKYGASSIVSREIDTDLLRYLEVSRIEADHAAALHALYESVARGELTKAQGLETKEKLFSKMSNSCKTIFLRTMAGCEALKNNADFGVAFKYAQHYRLFYDLHKTCGEDVRKTGLILSGLAHAQLTEETYLHRVSLIISKELTCP
jgi:predicted aminopeptidase